LFVWSEKGVEDGESKRRNTDCAVCPVWQKVR
jgi:hypothetical protein